MEDKAIFILDQNAVITVDQEKFLLVREVIKHYTPRWQNEAMEASKNGQTFSIGAEVSKMLNKLSVTHSYTAGSTVLAMSIIPNAQQVGADEAEPAQTNMFPEE